MAREAIIDVLESRFREVPSSLGERLEHIADRAILEDLLRKAVTIASPEELEKQIPPHN
ncbi:MAG: hypothetical protein ACMUIA_04120 [bacterium]